MERTLHAVFDLLDRQIIDRDGEQIGKVDDLLLEEAPGGRLRVGALLVGPQAYGHRLGGHIGRWIVDASRRLAGEEGPLEIPVSAIEEISDSVRLRVGVSELDRARRVEHWLERHVVGRLPGSRHAAE